MDQRIQMIITALDKTGPAMKSVGAGLATLKAEAMSLKASFGGIGTMIAGAMGGMAIMGLVKSMMDFNSKLETGKLGIAAILTSMAEIKDPQGNILEGQEKFNAAQKLAVGAQKELLIIGMNTAATYAELVEVYQGILAPALSAKMTMAQILEITGLMTNAVKAIGLPMNQIKQEARDLIQGGIQAASSSLATSLSITDAMVKKWREAGTVYQELKKRMEGFVIASNLFGNTWEGIWSNFKDAMQMLVGFGGTALFNQLKGTVKDLASVFMEVKYNASGAIESATIKDDVLYKARQLGSILAQIVDTLKMAAYWAWEFAKRIPLIGTALEGIHIMRTRDEIEKLMAAQGTAGTTKIRNEDIVALGKQGMGAEDIAKAISQGIITVGPEEKTPMLGGVITQLHGGRATYDPQALKDWRKKQADEAMGAGYTADPKKGAAKDDGGKKAKADEKLLEQIYKLQGEEEKLIEIKAKEYLDEGLNKTNVALWKNLELTKLRHDWTIKVDQAVAKGTKETTETWLNASEAQQKLQEDADALATRREKLAVDTGELTQAQAVNNEYDRKIVLLKAALEELQNLIEWRSQQPGAEEAAPAIDKRYLELRNAIGKAEEERPIAIKEQSRRDAEELFGTMQNFAQGYQLFRETQLNELAAKMRNAGIAEVDIQRWKTEEIKKLTIQEAEFKLKYATSTTEALKAQYDLTVLNAKSAFQNMAEDIKGIFEELQASLDDVFFDAMTGKFKTLKEYATSLLESIARILSKRLAEDLIGTNTGGGLFGQVFGDKSSGSGSLLGAGISFLGSIFGFGGGGIGKGAQPMNNVAGTPGGMGMGSGFEGIAEFHRGGPIRLHLGGPSWLERDEVPIIGKKGEYMIQERAASALGPANLAMLNQGKIPGGDGTTISVPININGANIKNSDISELRGAIEDVCDGWARRRF